MKQSQSSFNSKHFSSEEQTSSWHLQFSVVDIWFWAESRVAGFIFLITAPNWSAFGLLPVHLIFFIQFVFFERLNKLKMSPKTSTHPGAIWWQPVQGLTDSGHWSHSRMGQSSAAVKYVHMLHICFKKCLHLIICNEKKSWYEIRWKIFPASMNTAVLWKIWKAGIYKVQEKFIFNIALFFSSGMTTQPVTAWLIKQNSLMC